MEAYGAAIESKCDGIVAIGSGSALGWESCRNAATNIGTDVDGSISNIYTYLESVGEGKSIKLKPLPLIAVPTTSGTK